VTQHLSDEELQRYLDDPLPGDAIRLTAHLAACPACRNELQHYKELYGVLAQAPEVALARGFAKGVVKNIESETLGQLHKRLWQGFVLLFVFLVSVQLCFYYVGPAELLNAFRIFPADKIRFAWFDALPQWSPLETARNFLNAWDSKDTLLLMAGLVLLVMSLLDRVIGHSRKPAAMRK
jgi:hypothetical protein